MSYLYEVIIGVLKQAKTDYINALKKNDTKAIAELETFFLSDYGQAMSMNNGQKIIELCRALAKEKSKGFITLRYNGEVKTLVEWAKIKGIPAKIIRNRLKQGCTIEKALTKPYIRKPKK